jgi:hypothetical protein
MFTIILALVVECKKIKRDNEKAAERAAQRRKSRRLQREAWYY